MKSGHVIVRYNVLSLPDTVNVRGFGVEINSTALEFHAKWNPVSSERIVSNDSVHVLFPTARSDANWYDASAGYTTSKRLARGKGYWIEFNN